MVPGWTSSQSTGTPLLPKAHHLLPPHVGNNGLNLLFCQAAHPTIQVVAVQEALPATGVMINHDANWSAWTSFDFMFRKKVIKIRSTAFKDAWTHFSWAHEAWQCGPTWWKPHLLEFSAWAVCFFLICGRVWKHSRKHCSGAFLELLNSFAWTGMLQNSCMQQPSVYINSPHGRLKQHDIACFTLKLRWFSWPASALSYRNLLTLQLIPVEPLLLQLSCQGSDLRFPSE